MKPFTHQIETIQKLDSQFKKTNKSMIVLPSGSGKTHTIAFHVNKVKPKTFLYLVHRNEILFQSKNIFKQVCGWAEEDIGIINSDFKQFDRKYLFATVQTLHRPKNLEKMSHDIDYVALDEYHHAAADTYQKITHYFRNAKKFVGMTATPYRLDDKDIHEFVGNNTAGNLDLFEGIERKILAPFHYIGLYDDIDYTKIKYSGFTYNIADLDRKLIIHKRDEAVIDEYRKKIEPEGRLTIAFCNSISHVNRITSKFRAAGIKAIGITYHEKYDKRREILEAFKKGYYKVLFTRDILNEGVDFPECSAIMCLRPTISKTIFFQQLGRGLRKHPGKRDVLVLDFIGNYIRAFEKKKWFWKASVGEYKGIPMKPNYEYDVPRPVVEFDHRVIEIMDMQKRFKTGAISKQDIYDDYMHCCTMENKQFLTGKLYSKSKYRTIGLHHMYRLYGEFRFFVQEHNIKVVGSTGHYQNPHNGFYTCTDKQKLIDNYFAVKKIWNHLTDAAKKKYVKGGGGLPKDIPPARYFDDYTVSSYASFCYSKTWGYYRIFLSEIREMNKTLITKDMYLPRLSTPEFREKRIRLAIKALQEEIGRKFFTQTQWRKYMGGYAEKEIKDTYKSFAEFRKHFGVPDGVEIVCEICGKDKTVQREDAIKVCGDACYRVWVKKNRKDPEMEAKIKEVEKQRTNCKFCGADMPKYTIYASRRGYREKNYCSYLCSNKKNYWENSPRDHPMTEQERAEFVSRQMKTKWKNYTPSQKEAMLGIMRKGFANKYPDGRIPVKPETREKMRETHKKLYPTKHIVKGRFAKKKNVSDIQR